MCHFPFGTKHNANQALLVRVATATLGVVCRASLDTRRRRVTNAIGLLCWLLARHRTRRLCGARSACGRATIARLGVESAAAASPGKVASPER